MIARLLPVAGLIVVVCASVAAQETEPAPGIATPEDAARAAMIAMREARFDDYAQLLHPEAAAQFKEMMLPALAAASAEGEEADLLALFNVESSQELEEMDSKEYFSRFLRGLVEMRPGFKDMLAGSELEVLGHVPEGETMAHVVFRGTMTVEDVTFTKTSVMTLKKADAGWLMMLNAEFEGLATQLRQHYSE